MREVLKSPNSISRACHFYWLHHCQCAKSQNLPVQILELVTFIGSITVSVRSPKISQFNFSLPTNKQGLSSPPLNNKATNPKAQPCLRPDENLFLSLKKMVDKSHALITNNMEQFKNVKATSGVIPADPNRIKQLRVFNPASRAPLQPLTKEESSKRWHEAFDGKVKPAVIGWDKMQERRQLEKDGKLPKYQVKPFVRRVLPKGQPNPEQLAKIERIKGIRPLLKSQK
jgi:hypothetical protein